MIGAALETAAALREVGEAVVLRRLTGVRDSPIDVTTLAVLTAYQPEEILGTIKQGDRRAIVSNADIAANAWPGPPRINDQLLMGATTTTVIGVDTVTVGTETVRHNLQVRG